MNQPYNLLETQSNLELLTLLLGEKFAGRALSRYGTLSGLAMATVEELQLLAALTEHKARVLKAALLLAVRLANERLPDSPVMDAPDRVADMLRESSRAYSVEHFQILLLNTRRRLIRIEHISQGTLDTLLVHPREVFKMAIIANASAIVLAHNHPSGDPSPSDADIRVTRDLIRAGQLLKIDVLDHIIIGRATAERTRDYTSLRELGHFYIS